MSDHNYVHDLHVHCTSNISKGTFSHKINVYLTIRPFDIHVGSQSNLVSKNINDISSWIYNFVDFLCKMAE